MVAVALQWLAWLVVPLVVPDAGMIAALGGLVGGMAVVLWWVLVSRAPRSEGLGAIVLAIVALVGTSRVIHPSIANGMMGFMLVMYAIPVLGLAFVLWAIASRRLSNGLRRASMAATILLACGAFALLRTGGVSGTGGSDFNWRWVPSPEERLLSRSGDEPVAIPPARTAGETPGQPPVPAFAKLDPGFDRPAVRIGLPQGFHAEVYPCRELEGR